MISDMGVKTTERINLKSDKKNQVEEEEYECETCSANLYVSFVSFWNGSMPLPLLFTKMKPYRNCPKPFKYQLKC